MLAAPLAGRPVKSPVTNSSSVHSNRPHIFSSLSISGYARSASHFDTDCRLTPSSMASCSCVMLRVARKCCMLSRKLIGPSFVRAVDAPILRATRPTLNQLPASFSRTA